MEEKHVIYTRPNPALYWKGVLDATRIWIGLAGLYYLYTNF